MQVEAMGRLDAMLGRSLLHAPDVGEDEAQGQGLWLDADPAAYRPAKSDRDKGAEGGLQAAKRPDPSVALAVKGIDLHHSLGHY
jgi:hypothetical protein